MLCPAQEAMARDRQGDTDRRGTGDPGDRFYYKTEPVGERTHSPQPWPGFLALFTPSVGKVCAMPLEVDSRRSPGPSWI